MHLEILVNCNIKKMQKKVLFFVYILYSNHTAETCHNWTTELYLRQFILIYHTVYQGEQHWWKPYNQFAQILEMSLI